MLLLCTINGVMVLSLNNTVSSITKFLSKFDLISIYPLDTTFGSDIVFLYKCNGG